MADRTFEHASTVGAPLGEVFAFFSQPENLNELTPPWMRFEVLDAPRDGMAEGARIEYRIRVHRVPTRWTARIAVFEPPHRFVDEQVRGPFRRWRHEHRFEATPGGGTRILDRVEYTAPGWVLEPLVHRLFVRRDLERIFAHRQQRQLELFGAPE